MLLMYDEHSRALLECKCVIPSKFEPMSVDVTGTMSYCTT